MSRSAYPEYLGGYVPPEWPKHYRRDRRKAPREMGFIMYVPDFGAAPFNQRTPEGFLVVAGVGNKARHLVHGSCDILGVPRCEDWADVTAPFEFCEEDLPGRVNRFQHCSHIFFVPQGLDRAIDVRPTLEPTYVRLLDTSGSPLARRHSIVLATQGLLLNFGRAHCDLAVRYLGADTMLIEPGKPGGDRLGFVIAGPSTDASEGWGPSFAPCAGPIEPWLDLLGVLSHDAGIEAVELCVSLPPRSARMKATGGRKRTLRIFVDPCDFDEWTNDLLGWFAYDERTWPVERLAPGRIRFLKPKVEAPSKRNGGDHA